MKRGRLLKPVLWLTAACIILPAIVLLIWCFAARWPWPGILPESLSLRTVKELIFGSAKLPKLLLSSISLSFAVAAISTTIGIATARATELYEFRGKGLIRFFSLLPLLVPGTVLAIGAQIMLLKVGLGDSIIGGGRINTISLVLVPYIQGGDRSLASVYAMAFTLSALGVFAMLELLIYNVNKGGKGADA